MRAGASAEEAERASRRDFGSVLLVQEKVRETWGWTLVILNWRAPRKALVIDSHTGSEYEESGGGKTSPDFPWPAYELLGDHNNVFKSLCPCGAQAELRRVELVSGNFFSGLGTVPAAGRLVDAYAPVSPWRVRRPNWRRDSSSSRSPRRRAPASGPFFQSFGSKQAVRASTRHAGSIRSRSLS